MGTNDYLKAIRRRWRVIAIATVLAMALAGVYLVVRGGAGDPKYSATTVLLNTGQISDPGGTSALNIPTLAALVTVGEVPERVAQKTGYGTARELAAMVTTEVDTTTGMLKITVTSTDPARAQILSLAFADELLASVTERQDKIAQDLEKEIAQLRAQADDIKTQLETADKTEASLLQAQLAATFITVGVKTDELSRVSGASGGSGLDIVEEPVAVPASLSPLRIPTSTTGVLILALVVGLLAGVAIALTIERLDPKIRTKEGAEESYGYPVLAEIPTMSAARRRGPSLDARESPTTDAFRLLGTGLLPRADRRLADRARSSKQNGETARTAARNGSGARSGTAIMVTSADAGEGKTTVVANLAAVYAEIGKRVLVLSCDFRRPAIHQLLGVSEGPGMTQAIAAANGRPILEGHIRETRLDHVSIVTTGAGRGGTFRPSGSEGLSRAIDEARSHADVVLVDSAPVLVGGEAPELVGSVDSVLIVARAGRTNPELAGRAAEVLRRLDAPVVGIALNASREAVVPHAYYRSHRHDAVKT